MSDTNYVRTVMSNGVYDGLKYTTQIVLPAAGTLYFALSELWGLPAGAEVVGTIVAVVTFLGIVLGVSTRQYKNSDARFDGEIDVDVTDDKKTYNLGLNSDPEFLDEKDEVLFKVNKKNSS